MHYFAYRFFGQNNSYITIDTSLDTIQTTKICTDFQYPHCIENINAKFNTDTLIIRFFSETVSTYDNLIIYVNNNKATSDYKTVYFALDLEGRNKWVPIKQELSLNSGDYLKKHVIKGYIDIEFQEIYIDKSGKEQNTKVISFSGGFYTEIKK